MFKGWRRFRAKPRKLGRDSSTSLVSSTQEIIETVLAEHGLGKRANRDQLDPVIDYVRQRAISENTKSLWFALLILQAPRASAAQKYMDEHAHEHQNNDNRLFILIDFNDAFVSTVLLLSPAERETFIDISKVEMQTMCTLVNSRMLTDEQFEAITRGLGKEIAVYLGAREQGFHAEMTTRSQDAMGVDLIITDAASSKKLNIDCKTASAFRYRIEALVQQGRLKPEEARSADVRGYVIAKNGVDNEAILVTLFRVDPNELGNITNFSFDDSSLLAMRLRTILDSVK